MQKMLLIVEQAFTITGRGVIVVPDISVDQVPEPLPSLITLKKPNGTTISAKVDFHIAHIQTRSIESTLGTQKISRYTCIIQGVDKAEVPLGTQIWCE